MAHWVLRYALADDYLARRAAFREAHLSLGWEASERGELLLAGAVGAPPTSALLVFTDGDAARRFAHADPYVTQALVTEWSVEPWATVIGERAAAPLRL